MSIHIIIPARYASTRLPGKALLDVAGKLLIQRVHECAQRSAASSITITTDDPRIEKAARGFGAQVCLTSGEHRSGTDRIAEVIARLALEADEIVVNLQGDEPLMPPALIEQVAQCLESHPEAAMATACHAIGDVETLLNPNVVKVVWDQNGYALYFSRAPIPWPRDNMLQGDHRAEELRHLAHLEQRLTHARDSVARRRMKLLTITATNIIAPMNTLNQSMSTPV